MKKPGLKKKTSYSFTHYELNRFVRDVSRKNLSVYLSACIEEFGWTPEEIDRLMERLGRYMAAVNDGLISLEDIERMTIDELGRDIFKDIY